MRLDDGDGNVDLRVDRITAGYDGRAVLSELSVGIPRGSFTAILGPNGCGKSTLLRVFGRILRPRAGEVRLYGRPLSTYRSKEIARHISMLPQKPAMPDNLTVYDLVARGRYPHQSLLRQWTLRDSEYVGDCLEIMELTDLAAAPVAALSGGQQQRVWLAMVLAQDTDIILLDEPTSFLDIAHQLEVLDFCADLQRRGRTVVAVLHDINLALRYASHLVLMHHGAVHGEGAAGEVVTETALRQVFNVECRIHPDPESGAPMVVPASRSDTGARAGAVDGEKSIAG